MAEPDVVRVAAPWVRLLRRLQSAILDRAHELGFENAFRNLDALRNGSRSPDA